VREFLDDATRDLQRMRGLAVRLEASDTAAWGEVQNLAHNIAARAATLKLALLNACARELENLADEKLAGARVDAFFMQCVSGAIETIALEIEALKRAR
jgi:HPt (histidine-containing phosphotransfer) domain-containing protein